MLSASSAMLLVNGFGSAVGQLADALMTLLGPKLLVIWFVALDGTSAAYAFYRFMYRKREVGPDDSFSPLASTGPSSLEVRSAMAQGHLAASEKI